MQNSEDDLPLVQREVEVVVGVSRCISTWLLRGNEQALGQDRRKECAREDNQSR